MERRLKERLIGASVIMMLAVIFIPMILDNSGQYDSEISGTNIPDRPGGNFSSRIVPIEQDEAAINNTSVSEAVISSGSDTAENMVHTESKKILTIVDEDNESIEVEAGEPMIPAIVEDEKNPSTPRIGEVGITAWVVQLGSFGKEDNADNLKKRLRALGYTAFVEPLSQANETIYRVRVGPELLRSDAMELQKVLNEKIQIQGIVVKYP